MALRITPNRVPDRGCRWRIRLVTAVVFTVCWFGSGVAWAAERSVDAVIDNLTLWIVGVSGGLATLFLTVGGLRYMTAGGDPGEVEAAKRALRSAALGYSLVILAPVLLTVLKGIVGTD
ncbi:pilin [Streptomyces sp. 4N509B]|uniref:pilin n=1 Tax=Streptomyces sp. 4N509B TaxID=3457413 RepID=UPI003FCFF3B0